MCYWALGTAMECDEGVQIPILVNTSSGALHTSLICQDKKKGTHFLVFGDFAVIERQSDRETDISIALPMVGSSFRVMRFSLRGSNEAAEVVEALARQVDAKSTRDQSL